MIDHYTLWIFKQKAVSENNYLLVAYCQLANKIIPNWTQDESVTCLFCLIVKMCLLFPVLVCFVFFKVHVFRLQISIVHLEAYLVRVIVKDILSIFTGGIVSTHRITRLTIVIPAQSTCFWSAFCLICYF